MSQQADSPGLKVGSRAELPAGWPGGRARLQGPVLCLLLPRGSLRPGGMVTGDGLGGELLGSP